MTAELIAKLRFEARCTPDSMVDKAQVIDNSHGLAICACSDVGSADTITHALNNLIVWKPLSEHPKDSRPFWLGTAKGGVLCEAWHWCPFQNDFVGLMSDTALATMPKTETYLFADMQAPKKAAS